MGAVGRTSHRRFGPENLLPIIFSLLALILASVSLEGQNAPPEEAKLEETLPKFKLQVERDLVLVRVVVRNDKGEVVRDLRKEDFALFDSGKPQAISHFSIETPQGRTSTETPGDQPGGQQAPESGEAPFATWRYTALLFDDVHANFEELARTREAAAGYLKSALQAEDRVALVTSSGQNVVDFTDNAEKIHAGLNRLMPRAIVPKLENACPEILEYQAYQIVHEHDPFATEIAVEEMLWCRYDGDRRYLSLAQSQAQSDAMRTLNLYQTESDASLRALEGLIRRMAVLPGQRTVILVSPGFLTLGQEVRFEEIIDRALRTNIVINTFDARGLFAPVGLGDASKQVRTAVNRADIVGHKVQIQLASTTKVTDFLRAAAFDTGGVFFHNSNDYAGGFRRVGTVPEAYYLLGFYPKNLKYDGRFHSLKIAVLKEARFTLQARRGYFAPRTAPDQAARAKEEIEQALFSQDQVNELPVEMHMRFFKASDQTAKLSVLTRLDLRLLPFRKKDGRNLDNLVIVTALFDRDGNYLTANEKRLEFRLRDSTLDRYSRTGVSMKADFDVKPGTYLVRQVVRDADGGQLSGLSRTIEIPF